GIEPARQKPHQGLVKRDCVSVEPFPVLCRARHKPSDLLRVLFPKAYSPADQSQETPRAGPHLRREPPKRPSSTWSLEKPGNHLAESGKFVGEAPACQETMAVIVQAETLRHAYGPTRRQVPRQNRCEVVGCIFPSEGVTISKPTIHLHTGHEIFSAPITAP